MPAVLGPRETEAGKWLELKGLWPPEDHSQSSPQDNYKKQSLKATISFKQQSPALGKHDS